LTFTELIQASKQELTGNLDALLRVDKTKLEDDCYERALQAAVEKGKCTNAKKLILAGAGNIEAIKHSQRVDIALMLLMVKAANENDFRVLQSLFSFPDSEEILTYFVKPDKLRTQNDEEPIVVSKETMATASLPGIKHILSPEKIKKEIDGGKLRTKVPIKLAIKYNHKKVLNELVLKTNVGVDNGSGGWSGLSLNEIEIKNLQMQPEVIKFFHNEIASLPFGIATYLKSCTRFYLQNNNITIVPYSILELPFVQVLDLSFNKISTLLIISWCASLVQLNLPKSYWYIVL